MRRYLLLLLVVCLLVTGCAKKKTVIEYEQEAHDKILELVGKTTSDRVVIKINKSSNLQYYVYEINNINFTLYSYTFYNTKADYEEAVAKFKENSRLELSQDDAALVTRILIQNGSSSDESKNLRDSIINKYKDDDDYEIIE